MSGSPQPSGPSGTRAVSAPAWHRTLIAVLASVGLLGFIAWKVDPLRLWEVLSHTRPGFLILACASAGGGLSMVAWRWHWMLRLRGVADDWWASGQTTLIGYGLTMVLPGALFADVVKSFHHSRRHGRPLEELLLVCGLDRFAGMLGLGVYGILIVAVALPLAAPPGMGFDAPRWKGRPSSAWLVLVPLAAFVFWRAGRHPSIRAALERGKSLVLDGWKALRNRPGLLLGAGLLSVAGNLLVAGTLAWGLASVAPEPLPWGRILWTLPVIGLAAAFPFTVAGAGAREGAAIALWSACGIAAPVAVAACLVTLTANLLWAAMGGLLLSATSTAHAQSGVGSVGR